MVFNDEVHVSYARAETDYVSPWGHELQDLIWFDTVSCFVTAILLQWRDTYYFDRPDASRRFRNVFARQLSYMVYTTNTEEHGS